MNQVLTALNAPAPVRFAAKALCWPFQWLGLRGDPSMPPATRALTALGPAYVKFGQILSTRPDVVGDEMAMQLRVLQDKLPAFPKAVAKAEVEKELGIRVDDVFSEFSEPVAAASIAQVHRARLADTEQEVAVKVLRPGIERAFRKDIDAFYFAAQMIELLSPSSRRLRPMDVITHFDGVVTGELDLRLESSAASEFSENTADDAGFRLPNVVWDLSARRVLTAGWAEGLPCGEVDLIREDGHDLDEIGRRILQLFLTHALRDGYFHGDMHHGNMKIAQNGDIIAYDFGIMGRIDEYTRRVYAEILFGFIQRDYRRVAEVHFEAGYVPCDRDVDAFAQALRAVGEPIFGMDASRISMGRLLAYLFEVTERFGMETRTELILLQRTMVVVEGVARTFNPQINMWEVAKPVVEDYIKTNLGPRAFARDLGRSVAVLARMGPRLPTLLEEALRSERTQDPSTPRKPPRRAAWVMSLVFVGGLLVGGLAVWFI